MSALTDRIEQAIAAYKSVFLDLNNGLKINLNASAGDIHFYSDNGSDYIEVKTENGSILYNLNMTIAIKISN
ncbi:hypothetical protein [Legionella hackeliae]|uniref:Uncharacterized protein n=1 Tax=Legionella hackeliae TaxID=449 RepID=A0A0A8UQK1_LEGHA|nr:hypothetical protein [Legionella hackeliae]KTD09665.1 hypothetical protein Lhac_2033 [Legionella hackeliae]CEK11018.1 protein of unknown function [Legionella hackeliae]STX47760.1 Uncharacterised protein [Legionella hackeliae]